MSEPIIPHRFNWLWPIQFTCWIEKDAIEGVRPKDYNHPALDKVMLGELIEPISGIGLDETTNFRRNTRYRRLGLIGAGKSVTFRR